MVSVFEASVVDRAFGPRFRQTKEKKGCCCFSAKHVTNGIRLMLCLERHVSLWTIVAVNYHYTNPTESVGLVESGYHIDI